MWASDHEMARAVAAQLVKLLHPQQHAYDPEPSPKPFAPEKPQPNESYLERMQRKIRDDVRAGKAVTMNSIGESVPRARSPRAPGRQKQYFGGAWWYIR